MAVFIDVVWSGAFYFFVIFAIAIPGISVTSDRVIPEFLHQSLFGPMFEAPLILGGPSRKHYMLWRDRENTPYI
ncbi:MAG: hypothetical protein EBT18_08835 [Gammaproteobacteria bacterium]|nr:hypothetical protein [Gammaproteobacteria bacterium]